MKKGIISLSPLPTTPITARTPEYRKPPRKWKNRMTLKQKKIIVAYAKTGSNKKAAEMAKVSPGYVGQIINSDRGKAELAPVLNLLTSHRTAVLNELQRREATLSAEDYKTLLQAVDILTKNHQLLSGGATENVAVADVTEKYNALINAVKRGESVVVDDPVTEQNDQETILS